MTKFEHMKETVLNIVSALDEEELRKLVNDTDMSESDSSAVFSCSLCEKIYGECVAVYDNANCIKKYLDWCGEKYVPNLGIEDEAERVFKGNSIGSRICRLRKALHYTRAEFAELFDTTSGYISAIESERSAPSKMLVKFICEKMNINRAWLVHGAGSLFGRDASKEEAVTMMAATIRMLAEQEVAARRAKLEECSSYGVYEAGIMLDIRVALVEATNKLMDSDLYEALIKRNKR